MAHGFIGRGVTPKPKYKHGRFGAALGGKTLELKCQKWIQKIPPFGKRQQQERKERKNKEIGRKEREEKGWK